MVLERNIARFVMLAATAAVVAGCAKERPLQPLPPEARIYACGNGYTPLGPTGSLVFIYSCDSLTILDSMLLPAPSVDAVAGADGRTLFLATGVDLHPHSIWKFDLAGKQPAWHYDLTPRGGGVYYVEGRLIPLNDGRWLLYYSTIITTTDGSLVKSLPDDQILMGGPPSGTKVALGVVPHGGEFPTTVRGYDLAGDSGWGFYAPHLESGEPLDYVTTADLHPDLKRVLVIGLGPDRAWFVIGDLTTGETLLEQALIYSHGEIAISADGARAVVSDPSLTLIYDSYPTIDIFDLDRLQHLKRFTWGGPGGEVGGTTPGQLAWVPGTDMIVTAPSGDGNSNGWLTVIDVRGLRIVQDFWLPGEEVFWSPRFMTGGLAAGLVTPSR